MKGRITPVRVDSPTHGGRLADSIVVPCTYRRYRSGECQSRSQDGRESELGPGRHCMGDEGTFDGSRTGSMIQSLKYQSCTEDRTRKTPEDESRPFTCLNDSPGLRSRGPWGVLVVQDCAVEPAQTPNGSGDRLLYGSDRSPRSVGRVRDTKTE